MKTVDLSIVNTTTGCRQYISVCEPVDEAFIVNNALKRFGLTMGDLDVMTNTVDPDLETIVAKVKNTTSVVTILIF